MEGSRWRSESEEASAAVSACGVVWSVAWVLRSSPSPPLRGLRQWRRLFRNLSGQRHRDRFGGCLCLSGQLRLFLFATYLRQQHYSDHYNDELAAKSFAGSPLYCGARSPLAISAAGEGDGLSTMINTGREKYIQRSYRECRGDAALTFALWQPRFPSLWRRANGSTRRNVVPRPISVTKSIAPLCSWRTR